MTEIIRRWVREGDYPTVYFVTGNQLVALMQAGGMTNDEVEVYVFDLMEKLYQGTTPATFADENKLFTAIQTLKYDISDIEPE